MALGKSPSFSENDDLADSSASAAGPGPASDDHDAEDYAAAYKQANPEKFSTYMRRRAVVFGVAYVGYVCAYLVRNNFKLQSENIRLEQGWTLASIGVILTAFTVTYGISKFLMGAVSDRVPLKRIFAACLLLSALICISIGFVHSYWLLFILMLLLGVAQGGLAPSSMSMIAHWYPNTTRGSGIAIWNTSQNLGGALLPLIITWVTTSVMPGSTMIGFLFPGVIVVIISFFIWKFGGNQPQDEGLGSLTDVYGHAGEPQVEEVPDEGYIKTFVHFVLTSPVLLVVALINAILYFLRFGIENWIPAFLGSEMGFTEAQCNMAFSVLEWVAIPGCFFFAWVAVKLPNRQSVVGALGLVLMAALVFVYMGNHNYPLLLILCGLMGILIYGPQLIVNIMTLNVVPLKTAGAAVGFVGLFGYLLGELCANLVMPIVAQHVSWTASFILVCVIALIGAALYFSLSRYEKRIVAD